MNTVPAEGTAPRPEGEQPLNAAEALCPALGTRVLTLCLIDLLGHLPPRFHCRKAVSLLKTETHKNG